MKLEIHSQPDLFTELAPEWNKLVERSTANQIFNTWEWQSTWWQAYQPGDLWVITCRTDADQLIGLAPWFIGTTEDQKRFVATIGCKEVTDYLDLIVDADHVDAVLDQFAGFLAENHDRFDEIQLCNIAEHSISHSDFPSALEKHGFTTELEPEDVCPVVELPESWSDYLAMLDKKQRHELRRKFRRAHGENSGIDWYIVGQDDDIEEAMQQFLELMASSDPDKARFLSDPQNVTFFKSIAAVMQQRGWLHLCFLTVEGERAAAYFNFDYNQQILVYNSGLNPESHGHLSPGIVLLAFIIQHAIETKHRVFDFLQGNETYKYHMGGKDIAVLNLNARYTGN